MNSQDWPRIAVIGSGPVGIFTTYRLSGLGHKVDLIEAGYRDRESELNKSKYDFETPTLMPDGVHFFGGGSNAWIGRIGEFLQSDFHPRNRESLDKITWPIEYKDLYPYYLEVFELLTGKSITDKAILTSNYGSLLQKLPTTLLIRPIRYYSKIKLENIKKELERTNNVNIMFDSWCIRIISIDNGTYKLIIKTGAAVSELEYDFIFVAAGTLQSYNLLASSSTVGSINARSNMGKYLMEHFDGFIGQIKWSRRRHVNTLKQLILNRHRKSKFKNTGISISLSENMKETHGLANVSFEIVPRTKTYHFQFRKLQSTKDLVPFILFNSERLLKKLLGIPRFLFSIISGTSAYSIWVKGEELSSPEVSLTIQNCNGQMRLIYRHAPSLESLRAFLKSIQFLKNCLEEANIGEVELDNSLFSGDLALKLATNWHPMGALRMANSDKYGVCDSNCKVFGTEGVFVVDASVFPTGSNQNPTFTAIANSLRVVDHFSRLLRFH